VVTRVCVCLCVCVCLSAAACLHYCTDPDVTWGSSRGHPVVVHYWADLQSGHGLHCYGNITRTQNVSEYMLAVALCLVNSVLMRTGRFLEHVLTDVALCVTGHCGGWCHGL